MSIYFLRRLEAFGPLPEDDKRLIQSLTLHSEAVDANKDIIREGDRPNDVNLIAGGFAIRYKLLSNGNRQIVGFLMPGDICDLHVFILAAMDHSIATLTETQLIKLPRADVLALLERPAISRALLMVTLVNESTGRDWLTNIGQRGAEQRLAHFLCEWHLRLRALDLADNNECDFPVRQSQIGEAIGLTPVHVNRVLRSLRERELIIIKSRRLTIPNIGRLWAFSDFRSNYLHMQGRGQP